MKEIKDLHTYLIQSTAKPKPTLTASGTNDDFQAELEIVEKEIEKAVKPRKSTIKISMKLLKKK